MTTLRWRHGNQKHFNGVLIDPQGLECIHVGFRTEARFGDGAVDLDTEAHLARYNGGALVVHRIAERESIGACFSTDRQIACNTLNQSQTPKFDAMRHA